MQPVLDFVSANAVPIASVLSASYVLFGAVAHITKTTVDDRIYDTLTKPVSWAIAFLTKKPAA